MSSRIATRHQQKHAGKCLRLFVLPVLLAVPLTLEAQSADPQQHPAPIVRQAPSRSQQGSNSNAHTSPDGQAGKNPHLPQWMESHRSLPLDQQQRALQSEPGFKQLDPAAQQRMHQRLSQLNSMTPQQRERAIDRTEAMERLEPVQRQQVRSAMQNLGALPEDRRRFVARTFRTMRDMPDPQRRAYLNSQQVREQFSSQERETLMNLLTVAPLLPSSSPPQPR